MTLACEAFAQAHAVLTGAVSMAEIKIRVANQHGLTVADLEGPSRRKPLAHARHHAMHDCRSVELIDGSAKYSFCQIGLAFGGRSPWTVMSGVQAHKRTRGQG